MQKYYILYNDVSSDKDYLCKLQGDDWGVLEKLIIKERIDSYPFEGLVYKAAEGSVLNDYPWTGSSFDILVFQKVIEALKPFEVDMQIIPSVIKRGKEEFQGYSTLNILDLISCVDLERADAKLDPLSENLSIVSNA